MPKCIKIKKPLQQVCVGEMRDKITLYIRSITAPDSGVDFSETFTTEKIVWSAVVSKNGVEIFDGTALKGVATHYFYIRYIPNVTFEMFIEYKNKYYNIIDVQNLDERDSFYLLRGSLRGTTSNPANFA